MKLTIVRRMNVIRVLALGCFKVLTTRSGRFRVRSLTYILSSHHTAIVFFEFVLTCVTKSRTCDVYLLIFTWKKHEQAERVSI